jgi:hypothetical protein
MASPSQIRKRDNYICGVCGVKMPHIEVHHIKPRAYGGSNEEYNLISLCPLCHLLAPHTDEQIYPCTSFNEAFEIYKDNYMLFFNSALRDILNILHAHAYRDAGGTVTIR